MMLVSFETGKVVDRLGCIKASEVHEVVLYEDRGKNLNYLLQRDPTNTVNIVDTWGHPITSEKPKKKEVDPLAPVPIGRLRDHYANALSDFKALTSATLKVYKATCEGILRLYRDKSEAQLTAALESAKVAIYDNDFQTILRGKMSIIHMAAYSATNCLVAHDKEQTDRTESPKYITPSYDPIVVTTRCTRVALEERILEMPQPNLRRCHVKNVTKRKASDDTREDWEVPDITWVNGVPGCSKTTWVVKHFELRTNVVITTKREVARDLKEKFASRLGVDACSKVRTMASFLVNGFQGPKSCD
ncbi:hypothetical protein EVAR_85723_1 [Eumeta japonica]|uniref:(+)RNA virus helicase C-terminal domain-containing protein n=1 Tax=Eumeta variegata TaxID=151549 RepID=A0A4C1Y6A3_EUMVA|nr:hypothetical protein EVAR_85723_1 [Eumeta japonica]